MRHAASSNAQRQKGERWLPGLGGRGSCCLTGRKFQFCKMKRFLWLDDSDKHTIQIYVLNDIELYTYKWLKW